MPDLATLGPPQFESRCRYRSLRSRIAGMMGVSEPQVRERRKTSGASLSEFELDAGPHFVRSTVVRIPVPLLLAVARRQRARWNLNRRKTVPGVRPHVVQPFRAATSGLRTHLRSLFARRVRSSQNSGHDGIRTHGHRMSSRDANATRIEVRRSVRTELRALEPLFRPEPERRCGAGIPPESADSRWSTNGHGGSERTAGSRTSNDERSESVEFSLDTIPHSNRFAVVRLPCVSVYSPTK